MIDNTVVSLIDDHNGLMSNQNNLLKNRTYECGRRELRQD